MTVYYKNCPHCKRQIGIEIKTHALRMIQPEDIKLYGGG